MIMGRGIQRRYSVPSFRSNTLITTVSVVIHSTTLGQAHIFAGPDYTGPYIYTYIYGFIHTDIYAYTKYILLYVPYHARIILAWHVYYYHRSHRVGPHAAAKCKAHPQL